MASGKAGIGYVLSLVVSENVFMGGAMVTDPQGLPLEFRYTDPVRATKLQRVLYGDVLEKYIHCDVIGANLISRLEHKPDLVLVADPALLPALGAPTRKTALLLPGRVSPLKEYGAVQDVSETEFFVQLTDSGSPVRVRVAPSASGAVKAETIRLLLEVGRTMNPLEPLSRVEAAVRLLWEEVPETPPIP